MSVFVDTGVLYPLYDEAATRRETARDALRAVATGDYGQLYTSDYVYDETVTLTRSRTGRFEPARQVGSRIVGSAGADVFELLFVDEATFAAARRTFDRYDDHDLSFTDASIIAHVETHDIDAVLSFDGDFDGIIERIDPADVA